ncbi:MAG: hypothetical protein BWY74_02215 [Firmicutes bacterium ADurb.Bin419]|nr:MAG: hypothetical protein BWY74_02215 [Firmicutes bacterium ADurb.Bin419]
MKKLVVIVSAVLIVSVFGIVYLGFSQKDNEEITDASINNIEEQVTTFADWPQYDLNSLSKKADIILVGEVLKTDDEYVKEYDIITELPNLSDEEKEKRGAFIRVTGSDIKVLKVLKGNITEGQTVKIGQEWYKENNKYYIVDGVKRFNNGNKYRLLFLDDMSDEFPNALPKALNPYEADVTLNLKFSNGSINLEKSKIKESDNSDVYDGCSSLKDVIEKIEDIIRGC